jgi:hypothetical protein
MIEIPDCSRKCFARFQAATANKEDEKQNLPSGWSNDDEEVLISPASYVPPFLDVQLWLTIDDIGCREQILPVEPSVPKRRDREAMIGRKMMVDCEAMMNHNSSAVCMLSTRPEQRRRFV